MDLFHLLTYWFYYSLGNRKNFCDQSISARGNDMREISKRRAARGWRRRGESQQGKTGVNRSRGRCGWSWHRMRSWVWGITVPQTETGWRGQPRHRRRGLGQKLARGEVWKKSDWLREIVGSIHLIVGLAKKHKTSSGSFLIQRLGKFRSNL